MTECELPGCHERQSSDGWLCKGHRRRIPMRLFEEMTTAYLIRAAEGSDYELNRVKSDILGELTDQELNRPLKAAQKRGRASRRKGNRGQEAYVAAQREFWGVEAWSPRVHDNVAPGLSQEFHAEVKYTARPNILAAMRQAVTEGKGKKPYVASKQVSTNHRGEDWLITCRMQDFPDLARLVLEVMEKAKA